MVAVAKSGFECLPQLATVSMVTVPRCCSTYAKKLEDFPLDLRYSTLGIVLLGKDR